MTAHTCHANGCKLPVPPAMFMCRRHWYALRKPLRDAIWAEYRRGQEVTKTPSLRYLAVQNWAISELAFRPNDEAAAAAAAPYLLLAKRYQAECIAAGLGDPLPALPGKVVGS